MKMVMILLQFIRAERTSDWQMHNTAFMAMLPWFAHYDHTNYTRWGVVYAADISQLETSHPDVYEKFMEGDFVVNTSRNTFNQISTDLTLEHVNKVGKVASGLIGITRSDSARDRWASHTTSVSESLIKSLPCLACPLKMLNMPIGLRRCRPI